MTDGSRKQISFDEAAAELKTTYSPLGQITLIRALVELDSIRAIPLIIGALRDEEKDVRRCAAEELSLVGEVAIPDIAALLRDPWWVVRYRACEALSLMKSPQTYTHLRRALSDERDHVRYMAAKGLMNLGMPGTASDLRPLLDDENPYVREMAEKAIAILQGEEITS